MGEYCCWLYSTRYCDAIFSLREHSARLFVVSEVAVFCSANLMWHEKGQSTAQTTGIAVHLSSRFIPTVERGLIDLAYVHLNEHI